jgi:predicted GH43/DUF377 family glycosyl hydrolase
MTRFLIASSIALMSSATSLLQAKEPAEASYLFSYFRGNGESGLHLAWSRDGLNWTPLNRDRSFLRPEVGGKLMRDPCIVQGPDGTFHMVWTTGWWERHIGVAHSKDLIHWSEQKLIPVMGHEEEALNAWAPEILVDPADNSFIIHWATTIPGRFTLETGEGTDRDPKGNPLNHRMYFTRTSDFENFTKAELLYEPGFNCIDASIYPANDRWVMFIKDETKVPRAAKDIRVAWGDSPAGPFGPASAPISPTWVEGPTALEINGVWHLYFDAYTRGRFEGLRSKDLENWESITAELNIPRGARHGTMFPVSAEILERLLKADTNRQ